MRNSKTRSLTSKPPLVVDAHAIAALRIYPSALQGSLVISMDFAFSFSVKIAMGKGAHSSELTENQNVKS